nr:hypothetical protein [Agrobacterium pusense]
MELRTVGIGKHPAASTLFHRLRHAFGIMIGFDFETKKLFQVELGKVTFRKLLELANRVDVILLGIVYRPDCGSESKRSLHVNGRIKIANRAFRPMKPVAERPIASFRLLIPGFRNGQFLRHRLKKSLNLIVRTRHIQLHLSSCPPATRHSGSSRGALLSGLQRWAKRRSAPDMGVHSSTCKGTWFTDVSYAQRYGN